MVNDAGNPKRGRLADVIASGVMVRAVGMIACAIAATGCEELVGLGPAAQQVDSSADGTTLQDALSEQEGSSLQDATTDSPADAEAGAPEAGYACGLMPQGNLACDTCDQTNCCNIDLACSKNPRCAEGARKLQDCIYDAVCVEQVDNDYADTGVLDLQSCTVNNCIGPCFPGQVCSHLATCCRGVPSGLPALLQVCISAVEKLDETGCQSFLDNTLLPQVPGACSGPPPADAGGD
jgi:hypothetical protein